MGTLFALGALTLTACGDDGTTTDAAADSGTPPGDSGAGDSAAPLDSSTPTDSATPTDTGPADTGPPIACGDTPLPSLATAQVAAGATFDRPLFVAQAPGNSDTLWVVQRGGQIVLVRGDAIVGTYLDVSDRIATSTGRGEERGLLGLAFHPDYATNGRFFIYYTSDESPMKDVVAEYGVSGDADVANDAEVRRLVAIDDSQGNHNGGMLTFGPDGFLYVGVGDEGGSCDRHGPDGSPGNGQSLDTLFGKILRLDVDNTTGGFAAAGNPFSGAAGLPQIWSYGVRNPWRFAIDQTNGDMYIADVGQNAIEEISIDPGTSTGGENFGWRFFEADRQSSVSGCDDTGFDTITHHEPAVVIEQGSDTELLRGACSITGGYVYRGSAIPDLRGVYLFGDWCSRDVASLRYCEGSVASTERAMDLTSVASGLASFGQDQAGELYLVFLGDGEIHKIVAAP
ncbi:MAG: PQQ-dependent sugar dehydrogenase [Deltaproteobacteria bacterium]|nr:PQQ-dependent sugar dehydrogenase [Deltaproteobacteria bacterium]